MDLDMNLEKKSKPVVTVGLIVANIIVYLLLTVIGDTQDANFMAEHGAMYPEYVIYDGQFWRILSSMFMHFGILHLTNNMVMLGASGVIVEKAMGHFKFLITYIFAGICGGLFSLLVMIQKQDFAVSAGASGAIFGLVGALVWVVIRNKGSYEGISRQGMIFMVIIMLYYGVSSAGVDNWDHLGGLIGGFLISIVLYRKKVYNESM